VQFGKAFNNKFNRNCFGNNLKALGFSQVSIAFGVLPATTNEVDLDQTFFKIAGVEKLEYVVFHFLNFTGRRGSAGALTGESEFKILGTGIQDGSLVQAKSGSVIKVYQDIAAVIQNIQVGHARIYGINQIDSRRQHDKFFGLCQV